MLCVKVLVLSVAVLLVGRHVQGKHLTAEKTPDAVTIKVNGELFARYLSRSGSKPVVWPIIGPTGKPMTRSYPLGKESVPNEDEDHIHQRSLWFSHGNVDGIDFWSEEPGHGDIVHREFLKVAEDDSSVVVKTRNDWVDPKGRRHCQDVRTVTFRAEPEWRSIDVDIELSAPDGPVTFKDTKEGSFGVRMAAGLTQLSRAKKPLGGHIVNSHGDTNENTWGKRADWVDYYGTTGGDHVGIAILNHPSSFRYPTFWHVRPYGLFAANPFGVHDFTGSGDGSVKLEPGMTLRLRYRVLLHKGDHEVGRVAEAFRAFAAEP